MYKEWLHLMCKWTAIGLDTVEYRRFEELTTKLDKHCNDCEEGYVCLSCKDSKLDLNFEELNIYNNLQKALDKNKGHVLS